MKISKTLLQAILVAVTAGIICSCEKPTVEAAKKPAVEKKTSSTPEDCIACGMG